jgi:hypothetical protein
LNTHNIKYGLQNTHKLGSNIVLAAYLFTGISFTETKEKKQVSIASKLKAQIHANRLLHVDHMKHQGLRIGK